MNLTAQSSEENHDVVDVIASQKADEIYSTNNELLDPSKSIETTSNIKGVKIYADIGYKKYFKMMQFGVPAQAVKLKMLAEGFDPYLLE